MALARASASAAGVSFRAGVSRTGGASARTQTACSAAAVARSESATDEDRETDAWMEKFIRGREESSRILIAQGYTTDEAVMEMVAEEIRAYRREQAELEALDKK